MGSRSSRLAFCAAAAIRNAGRRPVRSTAKEASSSHDKPPINEAVPAGTACRWKHTAPATVAGAQENLFLGLKNGQEWGFEAGTAILE